MFVKTFALLLSKTSHLSSSPFSWLFENHLEIQHAMLSSDLTRLSMLTRTVHYYLQNLLYNVTHDNK